MAPENPSVDDYHSRLHALYETLDSILHPVPERMLKKLLEDKFVVEPDFAPCVGKSQGENKPPIRPRGYIYFEKLNNAEHKSVTAVLIQYAMSHVSFTVLPPRFCKDEKKCQGHHHIEDIIENSFPKNLSNCFLYFY